METFDAEIEVVNTLKLLSESSLPAYATAGSAGMDLRLAECCTIEAGQTKKVHTGISVAMPVGMFAMVTPRSGLGSKGLILANSTGIIDSDYRGEIMLPLYNRSNRAMVLKEGERIAQIIFLPYARVSFNVVKKFTEETERGEGGFGSTGN